MRIHARGNLFNSDVRSCNNYLFATLGLTAFQEASEVLRERVDSGTSKNGKYFLTGTEKPSA